MKEAIIKQQNPTKGEKIVLDFVIEDLQARAKIGNEKYGTLLMTKNGRNALIDAYQEALDLVMYLKQTILESEIK